MFLACRWRLQIIVSWVDWFGRLKWFTTGFDLFVSFFSMSWRCPCKQSASFLPALPMLFFLQSVQVIQWMVCRGAGETISDFDRLFWPWGLAYLLFCVCIWRFPVGKSCMTKWQRIKMRNKSTKENLFCMTANLIGLWKCFFNWVWWHIL